MDYVGDSQIPLHHVYDVGEQTDDPVVVEAVCLVLVGDRVCLVSHVARIVPERRDKYLRDEDLFGVAACVDHAPAAVRGLPGIAALPTSCLHGYHIDHVIHLSYRERQAVRPLNLLQD